MSFSNYLYKQTHTITSVGLTNYQIKFTVYYGTGTSSGSTLYCNTHCNTDFSDIRFSTDDSTSLSYWIESYTSGVSAIIWVKFPTIAASQSVTAYYGNSSAISESSGTNTFDFFDDFDTYNTSIWTSSGVTPSASGSILTVPFPLAVSDVTGIYTPFTTQDNFEIILKLRWTGSAALSDNGLVLRTSANAVIAFMHYYDENADNNGGKSYACVGTTYNLNSTKNAPETLSTFGYFRIRKTNGSYTVSDNASYTSNVYIDRLSSIANSTTISNLFLRSYRMLAGYNSHVMLYDYVIMRACAANEPVNSTWGAETFTGNVILLIVSPSTGTPPLSTSISVLCPATLTTFELIYGDGESYNSASQTSFATTHIYKAFGTYKAYASGYINSALLQKYSLPVTVSNNSLSAAFTYLQGTNYTTLFSRVILAQYSQILAKTFRCVIPASVITTSGNAIRLKLKGSSDIITYFNNLAIVERDGSTYNGTTTPTPLTVNGSSSGSISVSGTVYTDAISYNFDETKDYLFIVDFPPTFEPSGYPATEGDCVWGTTNSATSQNVTVAGTYTHSAYILAVEAVTDFNKFTFTDASDGEPNEWYWDFDDGANSTEQNPVHIYETPGSYTVTLYASNQQYNGYTTRTALITDPIPIISITSHLLDDYTIPSRIRFSPIITTSLSLHETITSIEWAIDGTTYTTYNPTALFYTASAKSVSCTVTNNYGVTATDSITITVGAAPIANFKPAYLNVLTGTVPVNVQLTNLSSNGATYLWNFGDSTTSTAENPLHAFPSFGTYTVSLTTSNAYGTSTKTYTDCIKVHLNARYFHDKIFVTEIGAPIKSKLLTDLISIVESRYNARLFTDLVTAIQKQVPDGLGVDEASNRSTWANLDEWGHLITNAINDLGHRLLKVAGYSDDTAFVIMDAKTLEDKVTITEDLTLEKV